MSSISHASADCSTLSNIKSLSRSVKVTTFPGTMDAAEIRLPCLSLKIVPSV